MLDLRPMWSRGWLISISGLFFFLSLLKVSRSGATATTRWRPPLYTRVKDKRTIGSSIIMTRPPRHTGGQQDTQWVRVFTASGATCVEGMYYIHKVWRVTSCLAWLMRWELMFDDVLRRVRGEGDRGTQRGSKRWTKTCSVSYHHSVLQGNWLLTTQQDSQTRIRETLPHWPALNLMLEITKY